MKKFSLIFATAIIIALGTFIFRSMLTGSPASNPGVSSPAPSVSAATNSVRSALPSRSPATSKMGVVENYGRLPLSFEANHGQTDPQVKFLSRGHGYSLFLTAGEAVLALRSQKSGVRSQESAGERGGQRTTNSGQALSTANPKSKISTVQQKFE